MVRRRLRPERRWGSSLGSSSAAFPVNSGFMLSREAHLDALHAALEDRIVALNRVRGDLAANIFLFAVVDRIMAREVAARLFVLRGLVGHQASFAADIGFQDRRDLRNRHGVDMEATGTAAALN